VVDQQAAHRLGCDCKEVCPVLPFHAVQIGQLDVRLVNERTAVERVALLLEPQAVVRDLAQLVVDEREELIECGTPAARQLTQEASDFTLLRHTQGSGQ